MPSLSIFPSFTGATTEWWASLAIVLIVTSRGARRQGWKEAGKSKQTPLMHLNIRHCAGHFIDMSTLNLQKDLKRVLSAFCRWGNWDLEKSSNFSKLTRENVRILAWGLPISKSSFFPPETFLRKWNHNSEDFVNLCCKLKRAGKKHAGCWPKTSPKRPDWPPTFHHKLLGSRNKRENCVKNMLVIKRQNKN